MYRQESNMSSVLEAFDELTDVRLTLSGAFAFALALAQSGMIEPEALRLMSCLLDYSASTTEAACDYLMTPALRQASR